VLKYPLNPDDLNTVVWTGRHLFGNASLLTWYTVSIGQ